MYEFLVKTLKLSELNKEDVISVADNVMTKEEYIKDIKEYEGIDVWTTKRYEAKFLAKEVLNELIELEYQEMYDGWDEIIKKDIKKKDIEDIQKVLDRIINRNKALNYCYQEREKIEIDI